MDSTWSKRCRLQKTMPIHDEEPAVNQKPCILVVDDDPDLLFATARVMRNAGFQVLEAHTGAECLELAARERPALVLLDVNLPDVDGLEVCRRLKGDPNLADTFVVLVSNQRTRSDQQAEGLSVGADGYIARPIGNQELVARVQVLLRLRDAQNALRKQNETLATERAQLLALFDGVDDILYVADPETHELLYVNPAARRNWGEELVGKKCYRVLQNRDTPCPFCTNSLILGEHAGRSHVWEFQNEANGRWYRCTDKAIQWPDGRMVRFELASDITRGKQAEAEADKRMQSLLAVGDLAVRCAAAPPEANLPKLIADTLASMTSALAVGVSTYDAATGELVVRHLAVAGERLARINRILGRRIVGMRMPVSPDMLERMRDQGVVLTGDLSEVMLGAIPRSVCAALQRALGVGSFTGMTLSDGKELVGTAIIAMPKGQSPFPPDMAQSVAQVKG